MMCDFLAFLSEIYRKLNVAEEDVWHLLIKRIKSPIETPKTAKKKLKSIKKGLFYMLE